MKDPSSQPSSVQFESFRSGSACVFLSQLNFPSFLVSFFPLSALLPDGTYALSPFPFFQLGMYF